MAHHLPPPPDNTGMRPPPDADNIIASIENYEPSLPTIQEEEKHQSLSSEDVVIVDKIDKIPDTSDVKLGHVIIKIYLIIIYQGK